MFEVLSPKLFGRKINGILKCLIIASVIFIGIGESGYHIDISQNVMLVTNLFFSGTIIFQLLSSDDNAKYLKGYFAMPFERKSFHFGYAAVTGLYTLLTKTVFILATMAAVDSMTVRDIVLFLAEYVFVCLGAMTAFAYFRDRKYISFLIVACGAAMCFVLPENLLAHAAYAAADIILAAVLLLTDPYRFIKSSKGRVKAGKSVGIAGFPVLKYIFRYLISNKSYLISTLIMIAFCSYLSKTMESMAFKESAMVGMALLSVNTPLAVVVSSSRTLKKKLCSMPDRIRCFYIPYAAVLFVFYIIAYSLVILILGLTGTEITVRTITAALAFAVQAAAFTSFMEEKYTITKWRTESDIWHNPRKYILPVILTAETMIFQLI